jgi:hypothetical protein
MLPKRAPKKSPLGSAQQRRRSLFGRDRAAATPTKRDLAEGIVLWNVCTAVIALPSETCSGKVVRLLLSSSFPVPGLVEGEFVTVGITAEETSTYYHVDSSKPNPLATIDPWSRPSAPLWSQPAKKQKLEVVGKITLSLSSLFPGSPETDLIAPLMSLLREGDYQGFLLSLEGAGVRDCEVLRGISVCDKVQLLSRLSEEIHLASLSLSADRTAGLVQGLLLSFFQCSEMSDATLDLILGTLLAKQCCHEALLFLVEHWLQTNPFAELLADPSFASCSLSDPAAGSLSSLNLIGDVSLAEKETWRLFFLICWCVRVLAFGPFHAAASPKPDLGLLGVHLVRSALQFGAVVVSSLREREIDAVLFAIEILRPVGLLLPFAVRHDKSFSPCCFELLLGFFRCVTNAAPKSGLMWRFIECTCRLISDAAFPAPDRAQLQSLIHPRRTAGHTPYTLSVSTSDEILTPPFSLWNTFSASGAFEKDLLHFIRQLRSCLPPPSPQSKHVIAHFLMGAANALAARLKSLPSEVAVPPKIRKRVSLEHRSNLSRQQEGFRYRSVVATTLEGIIQRGEALPHLNPFDVVILFVAERARDLSALLDLAMDLNRELGTPVHIVRRSAPPELSTSHEDRMNRAPIDGRVSVRTGRRLVGSTITRRLLGRVTLKPKQCEDASSLEEPEAGGGGAHALEILGPFRLIMESAEHFLAPEAGNPRFFVEAYSKMCLGVSSNLTATLSSAADCDDSSHDKHLAATLEREAARVFAGYETLGVFLQVILASHQCLSASADSQHSRDHFDFLSADFPRVSQIALTCSSLLASDPFLTHAHPSLQSNESFLRLQQVSLRMWLQVWLQIIKTATCLCDSFVVFLDSSDRSSRGLLESHFIDLHAILERHSRFEGMHEGQFTLFREPLIECGSSAVCLLLASIELSCRRSNSRPPNLRRSSVSPQSHEFYRHLSEGLLMSRGSESRAALENPNYSRLLRLCLFQCCLEIISVPCLTSSTVPQSLLLPEAFLFPEAVCLISNRIVDAIDQWISHVLPPGVTPLTLLPPIVADLRPSSLQFSDVSEILNCLKLALQRPSRAQLPNSVQGIFPLSDLTTRVHHALHRWSSYTSSFAPLPVKDWPDRPSSADLCLQWSVALRSAAVFAFLDRVVARSPTAETLLTFFGTSIPSDSGPDRLSASADGPTATLPSERVSKLLLALAIGRGERFRSITSLTPTKPPTLPLPLESVLSHCHSKGIEWETHHQLLRQVLGRLLTAGYWELGNRIARAYLAEYQELTAETRRKESLKASSQAPLSKSPSSSPSLSLPSSLPPLRPSDCSQAVCSIGSRLSRRS